MNKLDKGYIHIYTGNGKGKTTAALGLALRVAGFGLKILFVQFMKDHPYNELKALERYSDLITVKQFCNDEWVFKKEPPDDSQKREALDGLSYAHAEMSSGKYDLIILDEVNVSVYFNLIKIDDVLPIIKDKPEHVELVLTGRYCPEAFYDYADLVTEMNEVKHYYEKGILSRKGIDS